MLASILLAAGCGVATDMAKDYEWRWGFWGGASFVSPAKLKVGVVPFHDDIGLGAPDAGDNLARLFEEELAKDSRLLTAPSTEVANAVKARNLRLPLEPQEAARLAEDLGLNAIITGSISQVKQYNLRKGWRGLALVRVFTSQREYVDAVLTVTAVDAATGIVLASRANTGEYMAPSGEKELFVVGAGATPPSQESIEESLDSALKEAYHRTLEGLAALPFKAKVVTSDGSVATIDFGADVGIQKGWEFDHLAVDQTITNAIGATYQVLGAPMARLKVTEVSDHSAELEIIEGDVTSGDIIQTID